MTIAASTRTESSKPLEEVKLTEGTRVEGARRRASRTAVKIRT